MDLEGEGYPAHDQVIPDMSVIHVVGMKHSIVMSHSTQMCSDAKQIVSNKIWIYIYY